MKKMCLLSLCGMLLAIGLPAGAVSGTIEQGSKVAFDYTLTVDGELIESSRETQPLEYIHGQNMLVPGLERALAGHKPGDTFKITVSPQDGYGLHNDALMAEYPLSKIGSEIEPKIGLMLQMEAPDGQTVSATIRAINEDTLTLDFNHPMAGKELTFDIDIISVE